MRFRHGRGGTEALPLLCSSLFRYGSGEGAWGHRGSKRARSHGGRGGDQGPPLITRMPGYYIAESIEKQFDGVAFRDPQDKEAMVGGKYYYNASRRNSRASSAAPSSDDCSR